RGGREGARRNLERLETEMAEARAFQQSLLPPAAADLNGLAICCRYAPFSGLGGDLYDYAPAGDGRTALLIADVSGHGASAAMLTGVVKSAFQASHADGFDPLAVVHRTWTGLAPFSPERFVTLVAMLIEPDRSRLRMVNAGHPPVLLWGPRRDTAWLGSSGPLVSPALSECTWNASVVPIAPGDRLLLYTDGVSEALAGDDDRADLRLEQLAARNASGGTLLDDILQAIRVDLAGCPQPDDLTLLTATLVE